ncbi:MAG: acyl-[acyl-carrier-protein]--UDP-N-acetylglucosamine O-acyltransferase [Proteobacteria bacterium]|nr:MAG: acyl-[acyl-carrier-protein]--UDP-N-acetylglucosamine O-acyltransferase [Pseudomonadota bacterium]
MSEIHPTAVIDPKARIGADCTIGAYSVIGPHVVLGAGNRIASHVVIDGHTAIGAGNTFFQFASIGAAPQDLKFKGEPSQLIIGDNNVVREYVTLQPGTAHGGMKTTIGDGNLFMACSHVGHDAVIGDHNIFANSSALAGHVTVGSRVTIGGMCGVHQFVRLGDQCLLGAGSMVAKDIPPFCIAQGDRAVLFDINRIGLRRAGVAAKDITRMHALFKEVFMKPGKFHERVQELYEKEAGFQIGREFLGFMLHRSKRGIAFAAHAAQGGALEEYVEP